ncbi:NADP-dependent oxidoreductase domain-containing protein [Endogone sp. FLAS-F59071]|nr:NADP-dependent oxidoreductase domain-containing protein [Endogone sp. FLAS-F59071]|eukprot:RUS22126.1 NADP-dependent oxidoreductase domain-containing protein [Endogone sp. FLAS-F59071]
MRGFDALSNYCGLARMVVPLWSGTVDSSDASSMAWLERTQTPMLAWSSQARGFFVPGRARREEMGLDVSDNLIRGFYSEENFAKLERIQRIAKEKGVLPTQVAVAWLLRRSFPVFAIVGPRRLDQWRETLATLSVELSEDECKWLSLEE